MFLPCSHTLYLSGKVKSTIPSHTRFSVVSRPALCGWSWQTCMRTCYPNRQVWQLLYEPRWCRRGDLSHKPPKSKPLVLILHNQWVVICIVNSCCCTKGVMGACLTVQLWCTYDTVFWTLSFLHLIVAEVESPLYQTAGRGVVKSPLRPDSGKIILLHLCNHVDKDSTVILVQVARSDVAQNNSSEDLILAVGVQISLIAGPVDRQTDRLPHLVWSWPIAKHPAAQLAGCVVAGLGGGRSLSHSPAVRWEFFLTFSLSAGERRADCLCFSLRGEKSNNVFCCEYL